MSGAERSAELLDFPVVRSAEEEHAALFGALNQLVALPASIVQRLRLFTDDQVLQMWQYAREWGAKAFVVECACCAEVKRRVEARRGRGNVDSERLGRVAAMEDAAAEAGSTCHTAYRRAQIFETFFLEEGQNILAAQNILEPEFFEAALRAAEDRGDKIAPRAALRLIMERKDQDPGYTVRDAREDVLRLRAEARAARLSALRTLSPPSAPERGTFCVLYADPPWRYEDSTTSPNRFIENHYPTMELEEICALPVAEWVAPDAILFLWATSPKLEEALQVMRAWDFTYRTNVVWIKDKIGLGHWVRQQHELLLIGRRGSFPTPTEAARPASVIAAPRGVHSAKPQEVYEMIEAMYPGRPALEIFARQQRAGWTAYGNEVPVP